MRRQALGLVAGWFAVLIAVGVRGDEPPKTPAPPEKPQVFTGKVVPLADAKGKSARGLALAADDGTSYPLVEDSTSKMLFLDTRLQGRPVRLTALRKLG